MSYESVPLWIREIPDHFKTQEMCNETVAQFSYPLRYVPDHLKTQEMCSQAVLNNPAVFFLVLGHPKTKELCIKSLEEEPWQLKYVPDNFITQKMCDKAVRDYLFSLQSVSDWFGTFEQLNLWYDGDYNYNDHEMIECYEGYKKRKGSKSIN